MWFFRPRNENADEQIINENEPLIQNARNARVTSDVDCLCIAKWAFGIGAVVGFSFSAGAAIIAAVITKDVVVPITFTATGSTLSIFFGAASICFAEAGKYKQNQRDEDQIERPTVP